MFDIHPKKLALMLLALILVLIGTDYLIHQILLSGEYGATADVWRGEEAMASKLPLMFLGQLLAAITFGMLFARGFASGCWSCALVYGLMMGVVQASVYLVFYAVLPIPASLLLKWIGYSIVQSIILGAVARAVYGPGPIDQGIAKMRQLTGPGIE